MKRMTTIERYWSKVIKSDGCWNWCGERLPAGYGKIKIDGRYWLAHRYGIVLRDGGVDDEAFVCHTCDNPSCVRPDHLYVGTAATNGRDASIRGRTAGFLKPADVSALREDRAAGATPRELAVRFRVSLDVVYGALNLKSYREVGDEIEFD